ncbi:MAG: class I SAM-dependent methyltransferase [Planctomycetota bacterium]
MSNSALSDRANREFTPENDAFAFGKNWSNFLSRLNTERIEAAERSMQKLLSGADLSGKRFLDAGSGSGLFSLAANRLGAAVTSFDVDGDSVACTEFVRKNHGRDLERWRIEQGSLLDGDFMAGLGTFDVVYCWGVAHHTGDMWTAINGLSDRVADKGTLVLAIYNDQLYVSKIWHGVKQAHRALPGPLKPCLVLAIAMGTLLKRLTVTLLACPLRLLTFRNPIAPLVHWFQESKGRGMHGWYDLVDWVGGWPFEVAKPEEIFRFLRDRGYELREMTTSSGHGCNEFVFQRRLSDA